MVAALPVKIARIVYDVARGNVASGLSLRTAWVDRGVKEFDIYPGRYVGELQIALRPGTLKVVEELLKE